MMRRALIPICLSLITACGDGSPVEPPPPTFVIFGIVETVDGFPLSDAVVKLFASGGQVLLDSVITGANGYFAFGGVRGHLLLKVSRNGYTVESRSLDVTEDNLYRVQLAPWPGHDVITVGEWIESSILGNEPPCDPSGWDAAAPCHRFYFTPSARGKLTITLEWSGDPQLDVALFEAGVYIGLSKEAGSGLALLEALVLKDQSYEVRVHSYYGPQEFRIRAELVP